MKPNPLLETDYLTRTQQRPKLAVIWRRHLNSFQYIYQPEWHSTLGSVLTFVGEAGH